MPAGHKKNQVRTSDLGRRASQYTGFRARSGIHKHKNAE